MPLKHACVVAADLAGLPATDVLRTQLEAVRTAGFDAVLWRLSGSVHDDADALPDAVVAASRAAGLVPLVELDLARFAIDHPLVEAHPALFSIRRSVDGAAVVDPRKALPMTGEARARLSSPEAAEALMAPFEAALAGLIARGVAGFRFAEAGKWRPEMLKRLIAALKHRAPELTLMAGPPGLSREQALVLAEGGVDALVSSFAWWDLRASWLSEEWNTLRGAAPLLAQVDAAQIPGDAPVAAARAMQAAAAGADGILVPLPLVAAFPEAAARAVSLVREGGSVRGEMRMLMGQSGPVTALLRADSGDIREAQQARIVLINRGDAPAPLPGRTPLLEAVGAPVRFDDAGDDTILAGGEVRVLKLTRTQPILIPAPIAPEDAAGRPRLVVESIEPAVADGDFPVKRVVGERVAVAAKVYGDGHEQLAAELLYRAADESSWTAVRMAQLPNDSWEAAFPLERLGRHAFCVEGWLDRFGGYRRDFRKKLDAGVAQPVDHAEGRVLVEKARDRSQGALREALADWAARLAGDDDAQALLSDDLAALMDQADDRPHRLRSAAQLLDAERLQARFSSWYELFPRSQTDDPHRHGTFDDVIARLPAVRDMGFDTLYFPPIHPIGRSNRKGPNNSLTAGPDDPGSPYAIGSADGGHTALHPELGSFDDFARLIAAAHDHGLEIALDFAIQCSPDHPWLKEHPGWFDWRPDGSIKYAENPPKKYQDIVNVDFYQPDAVPGLWLALRDAVLFWIERGVKTFRVDNPHTKPLPFWEWMIGDVRARHPDAIFLAEAFTRPAMMYRLAKIGFSQSYTYFTWRDEKAELAAYITELTTTAPKEFYRPHFFVNTPDINPVFLQTSGRPGFRIRAVLAATLSGLFGVYSGFELCEAAPVPGKEEYLDSEKYEIRQRDWQAPGNIIADITLLNRLRRSHPALQTHLNTRFLTAHNDRILYYAKPAADGADQILVMVSLDPHGAQETDFEVPLWEFGLADHDSIGVEDLVSGGRFRWYGKTQHIRLDPENPYRIWRIAPGADQ